eukprot:3772849-Amphidinium_carterae.3
MSWPAPHPACHSSVVDFQSVDEDTAAHTQMSGEFGENFLLLPGKLSVVDTGAVNGLFSLTPVSSSFYL